MSVELILDQCQMAIEVIESTSEEKFEHLLETKGYRWLKERELALGNQFTDKKFKYFIFSDETFENLVGYKRSLESLVGLDTDCLVSQAKDYLPEVATIDTAIVPVIKPLPNSFVHPIAGKTVVFVSIKPDVAGNMLRNVIVHELHHVGLGSLPVYTPNSLSLAKVADDGLREVIRWTQAFGEGYAMLAAAGSPDVHPNSHNAELKRDWDRRMNDFKGDLQSVEQFLMDLLHQEFASDDEILRQGMSLLGSQGPWYTVGWQMAVVICKVCGKERLIRCMLDPLDLLPTYNQAVCKYNDTYGTHLPTFCTKLICDLEEKNR